MTQQSNVQKVEDWREYPNESGLSPLGWAVLVKPYEQTKKGGMIQLPENVRNSMNMMDQRAIVVRVGPNAWQGEGLARAKPGDHVLVTKFGGYFATGRDGQPYRLVHDNDIFCRLDWDDSKE